MTSDDKSYIEIKLDGETHRTTLLYDGMTADDLIDKFCRLLVCAGFPPSVTNRDDEEGSWVWLNNDEKVVERNDEE